MTDTDNNNTPDRDQMIDKLVENLPALRAKANLTQSELADRIGIGRQTLLAIENRKSKLRWDTFLALVVFFSKNDATMDFMEYLKLHLDMIPLEN